MSENLYSAEFGTVAWKSYVLPSSEWITCVRITDLSTLVLFQPIARVIDLDDVLKYVLEQKRAVKGLPTVILSGM